MDRPCLPGARECPHLWHSIVLAVSGSDGSDDVPQPVESGEWRLDRCYNVAITTLRRVEDGFQGSTDRRRMRASLLLAQRDAQATH